MMDKPDRATRRKSRWASAVNRLRGRSLPESNHAEEGIQYDEEGSAEVRSLKSAALLAAGSCSPPEAASSSLSSRFADGQLPKSLPMPSHRRSADFRNAETVENPSRSLKAHRASIGAYPVTAAIDFETTLGSKQSSNCNKSSRRRDRRTSLQSEGRHASHRKSDDSELYVELSALSAPQLLIPPSATSPFSPAGRVGSAPLPSHPKHRDRTLRDEAVTSEEQEKQWWEMMFDWDMWESILENPFCQQDAEGGSPPTALLEDKQHFDFASVFHFFSSHQQKNPTMADQVERGIGYRATTSGTLTFRRVSVSKPRPLKL